MDERHTNAPDNFDHDVFRTRVRDSITKVTHVVVGDHEPERKLHRHVKFVPFTLSDRPRWNDCPGRSRDDDRDSTP